MQGISGPQKEEKGACQIGNSHHQNYPSFPPLSLLSNSTETKENKGINVTIETPTILYKTNSFSHVWETPGISVRSSISAIGKMQWQPGVCSSWLGIPCGIPCGILWPYSKEDRREVSWSCWRTSARCSWRSLASGRGS